MNVDDALIRLGESTAEAVAGMLRDVRRRPAQPGAGRDRRGRTPTRSRASRRPAVAASVSYVDGVTGGNVFVMTLDGRARRWPPR